MARPFVKSINMNQKKLPNWTGPNLAAAQFSPVLGENYFDTILFSNHTWDGTSWRPGIGAQSTIIPTTAIVDFASTIDRYHLCHCDTTSSNLAMGSIALTGLNASPSAGGQAAA